MTWRFRPHAVRGPGTGEGVGGDLLPPGRAKDILYAKH